MRRTVSSRPLWIEHGELCDILRRWSVLAKSTRAIQGCILGIKQLSNKRHMHHLRIIQPKPAATPLPLSRGPLTRLTASEFAVTSAGCSG